MGRVRVLTSPTVVVSLLSMSSSALWGEYGFLPLLQLGRLYYEQLCSAGRVRVLTSPTVVVSLLSMSSSALRGEYGFLPLLQLW